jgi:DNA polymerase I
MLVAADASQLEWRTVVELSRDHVALQEILDGADTHTLNQHAFELPSRLIAKIYLFRTIFRGSGWSFANDPAFMHVSTDPKFWDEIGRKFFTKYKGIDEQHTRWANLVTSGAPIVGPFGREWSIPLRRSDSGELKIPWTTLTNYPVQGTGADVMMLARISFARRLKALGVPALMVSTVHDSIVVDAEKKYVHQLAKLFYEVFDDLIANIKRCFGYEWVVPLDCEVKYGMNQKNMTKLLRSELVAT